MHTRYLLLGLLSTLLGTATLAAHDAYPFPSDTSQLGYYNRPYQRYEAEPNYCTTDGSFLTPSEDQRTLQSEASHQQALQLIQPNSYVSWVIDQPGDGLTIRFSLPDNAAGTGTQGTLAVYANSEQVGTLSLDSYWAWQYCSATYPTNNPQNGPVIRMKYDETHLRLSRTIAAGETLRLVKTDANTTPYTIDFVELEPVPDPVTYESLSGNKVQYNGQGDLADFIGNNQGKIIYLPQGTFSTQKRIYLTGDNTQLIGAGMWYTTLYFSAPSDNISTYDKRGIEGQAGHCRVEGLYLNTINNQRYYNNQDSYQVGKGFMGWWGSNSVISHCWVEHFECGAWIADYGNHGSNNLLVEHCRFRNNYADGINCCHHTQGHTIQYCSFRNNGDDDMASWSTSVRATNHTFAYCTAENNWRASSLGIFGGENHHAHHLLIIDGLESGVRINSDFSGAGFSTQGTISVHDVAIHHCGCVNEEKGVGGDFWGTKQSALSIWASNYAISNVSLERIDIIVSRGEGVMLGGRYSNQLMNVSIKDLYVESATTGLAFMGAKGNVGYCNLRFSACNQDMGKVPTALSFTPLAGCETGLSPLPMLAAPHAKTLLRNGRLCIAIDGHYYDSLGREMSF